MRFEIHLGPINIQIGNPSRDSAPKQTTPGFFRRQQERESLWTEASRDPEVYAVRKACIYNCGWWTMAVSDKSQPDIANMEVTIDFGRHIYHDCPNIPASEKAKLTPRPRPSH